MIDTPGILLLILFALIGGMMIFGVIFFGSNLICEMRQNQLLNDSKS